MERAALVDTRRQPKPDHLGGADIFHPIAIHEEFDLTFTPPSGAVRAPAHIGPHVMSPSLDTIYDRIVGFVRHRICPPELGMEVGRIFRNIRECVIDLIIEGHLLLVQVFHGYLAAFAEGHNPVTVEGTSRIHTHRQRAYLSIFAPAAGKEIAHRNFDRGLFFTVPVEAQDRIAPISGRCHPDLLDGA